MQFEHSDEEIVICDQTASHDHYVGIWDDRIRAWRYVECQQARQMKLRRRVVPDSTDEWTYATNVYRGR